jgi:imidazolonepropionase-like amidohydrolase
MSTSMRINNVNILSPGCDRWIPNSSILIRDGLIAAIDPDAASLDPDGVTVQGEGQYLLPGLIEMHGHFYGRANVDMRSQHKGYCPLYLSGGITTVRTPGEFEPEVTYAWKQAIARGEVVGPRIVTGGWYFDRPPGIVRWFRPVESIEAIRACFDERDQVSDFFKVYSSMPADWVREVCRLGHAKGKKVYGHLGMCPTVAAIEAGLDGVEHGIFTIQEFYAGPSPSTDREALDQLDMDAEVVRRVQDAIIAHRTAVTPTMTTFMLSGPRFTDWLDRIDAWRYLSPEARQYQHERREAWDSDLQAVDQQERLIEKQRRFVGDLYRRGGRIFCGTDPSYPMILPGQALHWEAANLVDCGLPAAAVLRALTIAAAEELSLDDQIGSIAMGKQADLVLVARDPLADIDNLGSTRLVWKAGRMHNPEDLRASAAGQIL